MKSFSQVRVAACVCTVLGCWGVLSSGCYQAKRALQRSPSPANAVAYVHVPSLVKLMADEKMDALITEELEEVWQIAQIDYVALQPVWEAGYATLKRQFDSESLAKAVNGYVDEIAGQKVVWTPRQSYLIPREGRLGFLRPADRTLLSSWVTSKTSREAPEFLLRQADQPEEYLSFLFALNVENAFSPVQLAAKLSTFESLKGLDVNAVTSVLASTKGFSVIIGRKSLQQCIVSIEFGIAPDALKPVARELLNELLNRNHTGAPEVLTWDVKVDGNQLAYQGRISEASLDGLLSILSIQGHAEEAAQAISHRQTESASTGPSAYDTKKYFDRVLQLIKRVEDYEAKTTGYRAKWNDLNARRLDELPTLGVDPEMVGYCSRVAMALRTNAAAIRGVNISTGQQQAADTLSDVRYYSAGRGYGSYYGGGYYRQTEGYYDPNSAVDYQTVAGAQARMAGFGSFKNTMTQIDQMTGEIRRRMTDKYQTQF